VKKKTSFGNYLSQWFKRMSPLWKTSIAKVPFTRGFRVGNQWIWLFGADSSYYIMTVSSRWLSGRE